MSAALGATFGFIATASIVSNALFCFLLYKKPVWLKKPHNILLLTLATIDMMTGVTIFATPLFHITTDPSLVGPAGYIFCYLIENRFFVFLLSKASILTVTLLALERWSSVIIPFRHKVFFARKNVFMYIVGIFVCSALLLIDRFTQIEFKNNTCVSIPNNFGKVGQQAFAISYATVTFLIPTMIIWASFIHIWYRIKAAPSLFGSTQQAQTQQKLLLRMCAITAAVLTGCWLPSQIIYILFQFGFEGQIGTKVSLILSMSNSVVNPWIYFLSNKEYRKEFLSLRLICKKTTHVSSEITITETDNHLELAENPV
ncbi:allatostatin-A receptor-like [Oculina patagonica]